MIVSTLYPFCNRVTSSLDLIWTDNQHLKERDDRHSQEERYHQVDSDCPGEVLDGIVKSSLHRNEQGEEDNADTKGGQHHRHEILLG